MLRRIGSVFLIMVSLISAEITVTAGVDRNTVPINQTLTYTITVTGETNLPNLDIPAIQDFVVVGKSTSTQFQFINGQQSSSRGFIYELQPKKQGQAKIPALTFAIDGKQYQTNPLEITVSKPQDTQGQVRRQLFGFPEPGEAPVTGKVTLSKQSVYPGEKILVTALLQTDQQIYQGPVFAPLTGKGCVITPIDAQPQHVQAGYLVRSLVYAIDRKILLEPLLVQYQASPFSPVESKQLTAPSITVRALPNPPEEYSGAVGQFNWEVMLKSLPINTVGEAIACTITLHGQGNLDMVNELSLPSTENYSWTLDSLKDNSVGLKAERMYSYSCVPQEPGKIVLPKISFIYFDPGTSRYKVLQYALPVIQVKSSARRTLENPANQGLVIPWPLISVIGYVILALGFVTGAGLVWYTFNNQFIQRLRTLEKSKDFLRESKLLLHDYVWRMYRFNISGASVETLEKSLPARQKQEIIELIRLIETAAYSPQKPQGEIIKKLATIIKNLR
jgi:hypothetical protein